MKRKHSEKKASFKKTKPSLGRRIAHILLILCAIPAGFVFLIVLFLLINPVFGGRISKEKQEEYSKRATNYKDGKFFYPTEYAIDGLLTDVRVSTKGRVPEAALLMDKPTFSEQPSVEELTVTWFGHSTVLVQMHGMNLLFDPVFSERTSPVSFAGPKRFNEPAIAVEELPTLDVVLLTHDHYDHLDMKTIKKLKDKTKRFVVPLGVENHLLRWGIPEEKIHYMAWWEEIKVNGLTIACTPARHFSSRILIGGERTLFASFVLEDEYHRIFESGDGGYGGHFEAIHEKYGDFDLVLTDCAQYNPMWHTKHMYPEEAVMACKTLGAKLSMPIHWGAYSLSDHAFDDPVERFVRAAEKQGILYLTPMLGETVSLGDNATQNPEASNEHMHWWKDIK